MKMTCSHEHDCQKPAKKATKRPSAVYPEG